MHITDKDQFYTEVRNAPTMEQQYLTLLHTILNSGKSRKDRTGVGTRSIFGYEMRCNLQDGFPALTTKKLAWNAVVSELLWFLEGSTDERRLSEITHGSRDESKKTIWSGNANADYWKPKAKFPGDVGNVYGAQWRTWPQYSVDRNNGDIVRHLDGSVTYLNAKVKVTYIDQVSKVIDTIKNNPTDRRMIISAFNISEFDNMALPPCHVMAQFYVDLDEKTLSCKMTQRSVDTFLGLPFNIASYALLTHMIAQATGLKAGELIMSLGDTHIYENHIDQVKEQITRSIFDMPKLELNQSITDIFSFSKNDIKLVGYESHPALTGPMAV